MQVDPYLVLVYVHIVLFVYWLGGDLGVFVTSRYVADRTLSLEERFRFMHALLVCDMGPRTALILFVPVGFEMGRILGVIPVEAGVTGAIWAFGLAWLAMNWWLFRNERHPLAPRLRDFDIYIRYLVMAAMSGTGLYSLATGGPIAARWLAAKLFLFGCVMMIGVYLRAEIKQWIAGFGMVRQGGGSAEQGNTIIEQSLVRSRRAALLLWFGVALIAFIGKTKPF
jgi:hypothetical protein